MNEVFAMSQMRDVTPAELGAVEGGNGFNWGSWWGLACLWGLLGWGGWRFYPL
jgi:hypothetical protein